MAQVSLDTLIAAARQGDRLISMPTDTIPALASRPETAALIYRAKKRRLTKPLIIMAAHQDELWGYVQQNHPAFEQWQQVAFWYWPGALTLVLPASRSLPRAVNPTDPTTIGLRVPNCAIARHILQETGPLATTSVNRSGQPALETIAAINQHFPDVLTVSPTTIEQKQWQTPAPIIQLLQSPTDIPGMLPPAVEPDITIPMGISPTVPSRARATSSSRTPSLQPPASPPPATFPSSPSTVIRWEKNRWELLRQGRVVLPAYFFEPATV